MSTRTRSIIKPKTAQPVKLHFLCDPALADQLTALENLAKKAGLEIDIDGALSAALARLIAQAEKQLTPPPAEKTPVRLPQQQPVDVLAPPPI
ncbi:hypothetical protein [Thiomonas arsenitoxydans]|jgi:hypothetical protein|uniref:hypothetical protein n=1 Tax=Thiomonas arsenitoxydans (strain DSM 22701 / CIP 110005 / 3As) TaxID=426114 RepID=UPI001ACE1C15|nr:hypothetical protein [Thiomonas arsenitoxydans]MBN8777061.1 hypothetical protein [Thiomonas arsenitoxydans]